MRREAEESLRALLCPHARTGHNATLSSINIQGYMCQCIFYIIQLLIFLLGYTHFPFSTFTVPISRFLPLLNSPHTNYPRC
ncbi:hypothetical protein RJT34_11988 [Clitoria ternatea]|uniref:Uncharacterized protein n=1 Tax=Clitoria ternatea TaxID=43366 RepID=A0AAN9PKY8_CLITE